MVTKVNSSNFSSAVNATITAITSLPTISSVQATNSTYTPLTSNYLDTATTAYIKITGTNFFAGSQVFIEGQLASSITYVSSTQLNVILPNKSSGTYVLYVVNPDGSVAIRINAVTYSASPVWSTGSTLSGTNNGSSLSIQLSATSDSSIVYTVTSGTLPPGLSLSTSGLLSGTVTGVTTETTYNFTVTATDTENQINPSSFSINITVGDPYFNYTTSLLNGETTVTPFIQDASTNNFGLTIAGDTRPDKFNPYTPGYYSNYFDGIGDYLTTQQVVPLTGDFTIEGWINLSFLTTRIDVFAQNLQGGSSEGRLLISISSANAYKIEAFVGGTTGAPGAILSSTAITPGLWYHYAYVRNNNTFSLYINGVREGTQPTGTISIAAQNGTIGYNQSQATYFNGYLSNFRICNTAVYTNDFTPSTTPLTAISGTRLLTCQSNRLIDNSTNNYTITKNGDVVVSSAIPFTANSSYSTYGSAYFDGTGDYLSFPGVTIGTNAYTVECWFYISNFTSAYAFLGTANPNALNLRINNATTFAIDQQNVAQTTFTVPTMVVNTWYHVAFVRNSSNQATVYLNGVQSSTGFVSMTTNYNALSNYIGLIGTNYFPGYISDLRILKGTAIYTGNFLPPQTPLTPVANTQLLTLQYNGGATNYGIIDNGPFNNILTRYGNTTQGTFSPYSQSGWSVCFSRSRVDATLTGKAPGTGSFTYELFFNVTVKDAAIANVAALFSTRGAGTGADGFDVEISTAGAVVIGTSGATLFTSSTSLVTNGLWYHLAIVRNGTTNWTIYLNGSSIGTITNSTNFTSADFYLGIFGGTGNDWFKGYISNFRYTRSAVYTSNFTPSTTPLTVITNTEFLGCQSNRYKDNSANNFAVTPVTVNGSSSIQAVSPFSPNAVYAPSLHSGSAYFDGTGDYLSIPSSTAFTFAGDFTIEAWVYPTVINADNCIISRWTSSLSFIFKIVSSGRPYFAWYKGGSGTVTGTSTAVLINQWNHVAVTRVGSTVRLFVNGILDSTTGTIAGALDNSTTAITVGSLDTTPSQLWNGYLSDVRVINGTGLYSASFTPPTSTLTSTTATSLLLNFTNGGIIDASSRGILDQATSPPPQISTSVKKFGNASIACLNGTYMYNSRANPNLIIGTGDFTFEAWMFLPSTNVNGGMINLGTSIGDEQINIHLYFNTLFPFFAGSARNAGTAPSNTWNHYAIVRYNGVTKFYIDGVFNTSIGAVTDSTNYTGTVLALGVYQSTFTASCYIDDLRITRGVARYTSNFTVPTALIAR